MADDTPRGLPLDTDDADEQALWNALGNIEMEEPSPRLRQGFYRELERASRPTAIVRLRDWLGFGSNTGWLTAAACLLAGIGTGMLVSGGSDAPDARLAALEENVTMLNRRLILDRLENEAPGKRLRGVMDAAQVVGRDAEVTQALLARATQDRVPSVRSAAIDALGVHLQAPAVSEPLMNLLTDAESPIVQLALVDLVLRYGNADQVNELLALAEDDRLHPDLGRHVIRTLKGDVA